MKKIIVIFLSLFITLMAAESVDMNSIQNAFSNTNDAEEWNLLIKNELKNVDIDIFKEILKIASNVLNQKNISLAEKREFAIKVIDNIENVRFFYNLNTKEISFVLMSDLYLGSDDLLKTETIFKSIGSVSQKASY